MLNIVRILDKKLVKPNRQRDWGLRKCFRKQVGC